jgi:pyrimidine deaminase RibD-like protein
MELALTIAESTPIFAQARVGAVIAIKSKIIAVGFNGSKKHPFATRYQRHEKAIYPHAEIMVIHGASKKMSISDFRKTTLYVGRIKCNIDGKDVPGMSKPCSGCDAAIKAFNVGKVIYSTNVINKYGVITF